MIILLLAWMLLGIVSLSLGLWLAEHIRLFSILRLGDRLVIALWLGLTMLGNIWLLLSLAVPLSTELGLISIATSGGVICLVKSIRHGIKQLLSVCWSSWVVISCLAIATSSLMSQRVLWLDTGLYHSGHIQWLSRYGTVPGVALIHYRFGFVTSWLALAAPFDDALSGAHLTTVVTGFSFMIAALHLLVCAGRILRTGGKLSDWFIAITYSLNLSWLLVTGLQQVLVSPSTDIPIILMVSLVAWGVLVIKEQPASEGDLGANSVTNLRLILLALSAGAVTVKLSGLPLLIVAFLFYVSTDISLKFFLCALVTSNIILAPMILSSILRSGCPLLPSTQLCFNLPWTIPMSVAESEVRSIRGWGKWFGNAPEGTNAIFWNIQEWLALTNTSIVMLILCFLSLAMMVILLWYCRQKYPQLLWTAGLGLLGSVFVLLQAPLLRFGLGYFTLVPSICLALCAERIWIPLRTALSELTSNFLTAVHQSTVVAGVTVGITVVYVLQGQHTHWLLPPALPQPRVIVQVNNNVQYGYPADGEALCWAVDQPCALGPVEFGITLRRPEVGIRGGFKKL